MVDGVGADGAIDRWLGFMSASNQQNILRSLAAAIFLLMGFALFGVEGFGELLKMSESETSIGDEAQTDDLDLEADRADGTIDRVIDGDTVDIVIDGEVERFRLIGIDTPETVDPRKPVQCFGKEASQHLSSLLDGQVVKVERDSSQGEVDKYGRGLAYLILNDGTNVAEKMLLDGFAYEYTYNKPYEQQINFKNAEQDARDSERGLWSSDTCGGKR